MEQEKSSIDILKEFARRTGRDIEFTTRNHDYTIIHAVRYHQRSLYIPNNPDQTSYFICYGDSGAPAQIGESVLYSGVFISVDLPKAASIKIRKKDILDKLNIFKKKKYLKTGFENFDAKTTIRGNDSLSAQKLTKSRKVQENILEAFELDESLTVGLNTVNAEFVPRLKDRSFLGIYSLSGWILDNKKIEKLFEITEDIRKSLMF
jgi:hypothetical protein